MEFFTFDQHPRGDLESHRTDFAYADTVAKGEAMRCPKCGGFVSMLPPLPPFVVHLETWGSDFGDIAFGPSDLLVSRAFVEAYRQSQLRGLSSFERVTVASHSKHGTASGSVPEYFRTSPSRNAAKIDLVASGVEWKSGRAPTCEECLAGIIKRWSRVVVDEQSWDGSDVFNAYGIPGEILTSKRFHDWSAAQGFRNLILRPSVTVASDFYPWEGASS